MGNWSINPNTLASIDDNGKATFQEHTQDTNYTITYNDGTSGKITKTFTVYACSQPPAVEWVDLGLPSGKLWRAWNVGASSETKYGNYYQYGKGSRQYAATSAETPYAGNENPLSSSLDAATQVLNNANVHMPTVTEYKELKANTTYSNVTINGISGGKFTSSNGNYIFLPFGGEYSNGTKKLVGSYGSYLSSTPNGTDIYRINVNSNGTYYDGNYRTLGLMVRPVSGTTTCPQYQIVPDVQVTCDGGIVHFTATQEPQTKYIGTYVAKGSASPIGSVAENITFTAGGSTYTIEEANLNFDATSEAIPYPIDMLGKSITSVKVETEEGETFNARISPSTITDSTYLVTIQLVPPQPSVSVKTNLIISDGSSGGLRVSGSTYIADFTIAGPNAGTGTLSGTLAADTRDKMTFDGEWDGSPGGTIGNSCIYYAPQGLYAIGDAHWDLSTKTLIVNLTQCKP